MKDNNQTAEFIQRICEIQDFLKDRHFDHADDILVDVLKSSTFGGYNNVKHTIKYLIEDNIELNKEIDCLKQDVKSLENNKNQLDVEVERLKSPHNPIDKEGLKRVSRRMFWTDFLPFSHLTRNNLRNTEKYYNWLLPYTKYLDTKIPGFEKSWSYSRGNFDAMYGLIRAAVEIIENYKR